MRASRKRKNKAVTGMKSRLRSTSTIDGEEPKTTSKRAEKILALCADCQGYPCGKQAGAYLQPVITGGEISWEHCRHYAEYVAQYKPPLPLSAEVLAPAEGIQISAIRATFEKELAERKAKLKPQYEAKYGLTLSDEDYSAIEAAECDLKNCATCCGLDCSQVGEDKRYRRPQITIADGHPKIERVRCEVWRTIFNKKCKKAGIPSNYANRTFADYEITENNAEAVKAAHWFLKKPRDKGLFLFGGVGTGKTFLASLIAREYILRGQSLKFGNVPELLGEIKRTFNNPGQSSESVLDNYKQTPLLVLDDFGAGKVTDWTVDVLFQIVNARYEAGKPIIVTSNLDLKGLRALLSREDEFGGMRIVSRLSEMCHQAFLGTKDRRG